ncbi:MAG TPA: PEP-utilizing enzyme [Pirellulales bacterium]|nr:PEP-utilizing enzyme [Pirellulales bacterium]
MAYHRNLFRRQRPAETAGADAPLMGIGCCPGVVVGQVAVVHDPNSAQRAAGEILVAERTDPGWVPLYPAFSGILIERGSVLSHSAIVARELGIPTIVAVTGLTARLESGRRVRMDGRAGTVEILADRAIGSGEQAKPAVVSASSEFVDLEIRIEEGPIASE